ncbi:hypothetical protein [Fibrobacter sp. UWR2]|uniref:hypothetical protein n=1 Tax=Fibrobacter sp. UWR2 TaxID=1964352 RepID=UPI0013035EBC|nr:hypothetical protein [Fibrobacter sp. UWR2]
MSTINEKRRILAKIAFFARFYADDIPYSIGDFGPFRGWRRRGCLRHYLAVESAAVSDFRGDFGVFNVL